MEQKAQWYTIAERLPDDNQRVIVHCVMKTETKTQTTINAAKFIQGQDGYYFNVPNGWAVTHWMPLPSPPATE